MINHLTLSRGITSIYLKQQSATCLSTAFNIHINKNMLWERADVAHLVAICEIIYSYSLITYDVSLFIHWINMYSSLLLIYPFASQVAGVILISQRFIKRLWSTERKRPLFLCPAGQFPLITEQLTVCEGH